MTGPYYWREDEQRAHGAELARMVLARGDQPRTMRVPARMPTEQVEAIRDGVASVTGTRPAVIRESPPNDQIRAALHCHPYRPAPPEEDDDPMVIDHDRYWWQNTPIVGPPLRTDWTSHQHYPEVTPGVPPPADLGDGPPSPRDDRDVDVPPSETRPLVESPIPPLTEPMISSAILDMVNRYGTLYGQHPAHQSRRQREYQERREASLAKARRRYDPVHTAVAGTLRKLVEHHQPLLAPYDSWATCGGCDAEGHDPEAPEWPCSSFELIEADVFRAPETPGDDQ